MFLCVQSEDAMNRRHHGRMRLVIGLLFIMFFIALAYLLSQSPGCQPVPPTPTRTAKPTLTYTPTKTHEPTKPPTSTPTPIPPTPTNTNTPTATNTPKPTPTLVPTVLPTISLCWYSCTIDNWVCSYGRYQWFQCVEPREDPRRPGGRHGSVYRER